MAVVAVRPPTVVGMTAPPRRRGEADPGQGPAVRAEGAPLRNQMGVAPGALAVMGLVPAMGHLATHAGNRERHVATATAATAAAALPKARTTTAKEAGTMTFHLDRNVAAQGICQKVRYIPHDTSEGRKKVRPSRFQNYPRRRLTISRGSRQLRTE